MKVSTIVSLIETQQEQKAIPVIFVGDTVRVDVLLDLANSSNEKQSEKQRAQAYQGVVIAQHRAGLNSTITVRRIFQGIGVERIFPIHSPAIQKIYILRQAKVRRSKLYFLRERVGKATRLKEVLIRDPSAPYNETRTTKNSHTSNSIVTS